MYLEYESKKFCDIEHKIEELEKTDMNNEKEEKAKYTILKKWWSKRDLSPYLQKKLNELL